MKGDEEFRKTSKSFIMCYNEVFVYEKVIPYFKAFLKARESLIACEEWTSKVYHLYYGKIPELSAIDECLLAMEDLSVKGFKGGPRLQLDYNHLTLMIRKIAQYHSVQFAMRIENDPMLETLKSGITSLPWKSQGDPAENVYEIIYGAAFQRMFDYLDRNPELINSPQMKEEVELLRERFGKDPVSFLELFREDDKAFSVIQHGDYNRNNVLFQYSADTPTDLRIIDFQEVRYGSPAFDLFFFLYMSTTPELRDKHWDEFLHLYHNEIWQHLKDLLKCTDSDPRLQPYSFESFEKHFHRFAFYGPLVTIQFLPWMDAPEEELEPLSSEFETDMKSEKFKSLLLSVGGDSSNRKIAQALQHACSRGYLSFLKDL